MQSSKSTDRKSSRQLNDDEMAEVEKFLEDSNEMSASLTSLIQEITGDDEADDAKDEVPTFESNMQHGDDEYKKENFRGAIPFYEAAMVDQPKNAIVVLKCAQAYQKVGDQKTYEKLKEKAKEIVDLDKFSQGYVRTHFKCELHQEKKIRNSRDVSKNC